VGDITETKMVNGRLFTLHIRKTTDGKRDLWVGWVSVDGKENLKNGRCSLGPGLSDGDIREQAERWMLKWRN